MKRRELVSIRDTIQSIWVAIILAFVLRAFMLEAFEIPTGSMAPRLMGRHALLACPDCKYQFPRGLPDPSQETGWSRSGKRMARCPNCGEEMGIRRDAAKSGDRVLVLKVPPILRPLERWDVVVFKDVQENQQNYIKRLVGLPGEVLRIIQGDVFVHPISDRNADGVRDQRDLDVPLADLTDWQIVRKPHRTQRAMWQVLFDNDFQPAVRDGRRKPWKPLWEKAQPDAAEWRIDLDSGRVFQYEGAGPQGLWFARGQAKRFRPINAYNFSPETGGNRRPIDQCSDLRLETTLLTETDTGSMRLTLSSRYREFAGEVHFDGRVRLLHRPLTAAGEPGDSWENARQWSETRLPRFTQGRAVALALTHVDWRVILWVDGEPVLATTDEQYHPDVAALLAEELDRVALSPRVGITGLNGAFQLWHTRVLRDVYYTSPTLKTPGGFSGKYLEDNFDNPDHLPLARSGQPGWGTRDNPIALRRFDNRLDYDEFFMLGDNSPASSDSRLWVSASPTLRLYDELGAPRYRPGTVPRYNLIGKAFFVYWPSGTPLPGLKRLPLVPDVGKMRRIN